MSRALSDFAYCTYLSDLAVDEAYQRRGIGRELLRRTHEAAGLHTTLILLAAPAARELSAHRPDATRFVLARTEDGAGRGIVAGRLLDDRGLHRGLSSYPFPVRVSHRFSDASQKRRAARFCEA